MTILGHFIREVGLNAIVSVRVGIDQMDNQKHIIYVTCLSLSLIDEECLRSPVDALGLYNHNTGELIFVHCNTSPSTIDLGLVSQGCSYTWTRAPVSAGVDHYPFILSPSHPTKWRSKRPYTLHGVPIQCKTHVRYLGLTTNHRLKGNLAVSSFHHQTHQVEGAVRRILTTETACLVSFAISIYKTIVVTKVPYVPSTV
ncbi:hypothetical protein HPB51_007392 [Rhipicephalus microplus]|uniref:Uncharacterized protein n=1 Tax=Rhipicephalus microplus TaxID=6941 RepID=A0A9J6EYG7_RHIMP|nr:hypothetical protein HPB51_007392 [Rhipicephalus microplus]